MQCSKCGYVLADLETECLRCKRAGNGAVPTVRLQAPPVPTAQALAASAAPAPGPAVTEPSAGEKECPRCGKATAPDATACDKCGYEYHPGESRAERYQALLAEESRTRAAPPPALHRTVSPYVSWGLIGVCLLAVFGAGYAMLVAPLLGRGDSQDAMDSPVITLHRHKPRHPVPLKTVSYKVAGTAAQATVTYRGADGSPVTLPAPVTLPWTQTVKLKPGSDLSLSARPSDAGGTVTTEIDVDDVARKQADSPAADGTTSVTDTL